MHVRVCEPRGDGISSTEHLLDNPVLRARYVMRVRVCVYVFLYRTGAQNDCDITALLWVTKGKCR